MKMKSHIHSKMLIPGMDRLLFCGCLLHNSRLIPTIFLTANSEKGTGVEAKISVYTVMIL
jgi:CheY-like chemotaxis protein